MAPVPPLGTSLNVDVVINRGVGKMTLGHAPPLWTLKAPFAVVRRPPIVNVFTGKM